MVFKIQFAMEPTMSRADIWELANKTAKKYKQKIGAEWKERDALEFHGDDYETKYAPSLARASG